MKKLLVATSALVVAGPAFANDVTLSGTFAGKYSTEDATELSGGAITTLTVNLAFKGDNGFGGNLKLGDDDTPDLDDLGDVNAVNIYAETALGKFNVGTDTGTKTDDDLTEMNVFNDGDDNDNVDFDHGLAAFMNEENKLGTFLTYSNDFGPVSSAVTWADDGYVFSAGLELAGFDLALDYSSGSSTIEDDSSDASYVINAVGSLAGITVELEYGTGKNEKNEDVDSAYDLYLAYDLGVAKLALGTASNSDQELEVSGDLGDFGYKLYFGNDEQATDEKSYTGFEISTQVGAIEAGLKTSDVAGTTSTELYLIPVSGFEIELVDSGKDEADAMINFKVATSF